MTNTKRSMSFNKLYELFDATHTDSKLPVPQQKFFLKFRYLGIEAVLTRAKDLEIGSKLMVKHFFGLSSSTKKGITEMMLSIELDASTQRKIINLLVASVHIDF